ncbi:MAG: HlyD family efflux transporter periplasmic adaptor subunit [bacterium]
MKKVYFILIVFLSFTACNNNEEWGAMGTFEATEVIVSAEANGRILSFDLQEGDKISAGVELGVIDTVQLYYQIKQLSLGLEAADIRKPDIQKQIAALYQQKSTCEMEFARAQRLVAASAGNQKSVDDLSNQIKLIDRQIVAQESALQKTVSGADVEIERLQYQLMSMNDLLAKSHIINPLSGTVLTKYAEAGEMTAVGKPLYKIADLETMYLRVYITADQLNSIKVGGEVAVNTDSENSYTGRVTWISDKSEFTPKGVMTKNERANLVYAVKIAVRNDGNLRIGQYGEVVL